MTYRLKIFIEYQSLVINNYLFCPPTKKQLQYDAGDLHLQHIVQDCLQAGVMFSVAKYSMLEKNRPPPSIRVAVSAAHTSADIDKAIALLKMSCKKFRYK